MSAPDPRKVFLNAMTTLSQQFADVESEVKMREATLMSEMDALMGRLMKPVIEGAAGELHESTPLSKAAQQADQKIAARLAEWKHRVESFNRNTQFREDCGDSLLVFVYGKVKAGKSSLGNYVAYGHGNPLPEHIECEKNFHAKPTFFMRDASRSHEAKAKADALAARKKFAVGAQETTAEIQGFRLPGLTWIDSPGLHSVTQENGALSQEYAATADLIIYPMNSGQPGRASDLAEIASLLQARKPFLVVISRCDTTDIDFDDEGNQVATLIMKSDKDRQEQIDYVSKEILAKAEAATRDLLDAEVLTISVRYADHHLADPLKIQESGIADLFEKLTMLAKSEGVTLKRKTPLNNLSTFVDELLEGELSINSLRSDLQFLQQSINEQRSRLERKKRTVVGQVMIELDPLIEKEVIRHHASRNVVALCKACSELIQQVVTQHLVAAMNEILDDAQISINSAIRFHEFKDIPEFKDLTETITWPNDAKGRSLGGSLGILALSAGVAFLTGGVSLWIQIPATIAAAEVGRRVGGKIGEAVTSDGTMVINVGDNIREVVAEAVRLASSAADNAITDTFKNINQDFLLPVDMRATDMLGALDAFQLVLNQKVRPSEI